MEPFLRRKVMMESHLSSSVLKLKVLLFLFSLLFVVTVISYHVCCFEEVLYPSLEFSEQINEGLEKAILTMRKGEQALVIVRSNLLSDEEVIENKALIYEVELIDFTKVSSCPLCVLVLFYKLNFD